MAKLIDTQHVTTINGVTYCIVSYIRRFVFAKARWITYDSDLAMFRITCLSHPEFSQLGLFRPCSWANWPG